MHRDWNIGNVDERPLTHARQSSAEHWRLEVRAGRLFKNSYVGWQQPQFERAKTEARGGELIQPGVLGKIVSPSAENRAQQIVVGFDPAPAAFAHAALRGCSEGLGMALAHATCWKTRIGDIAEGSPTHARGDQGGDGHDGQKSNNCTHVISERPRQK